MSWREEAKARAEVATKGPWETSDRADFTDIRTVERQPTVFGGLQQRWIASDTKAVNADFIVHSREDLPRALKVLEEIEEYMKSNAWIREDRIKAIIERGGVDGTDDNISKEV